MRDQLSSTKLSDGFLEATLLQRRIANHQITLIASEKALCHTQAKDLKSATYVGEIIIGCRSRPCK